MAGMRLPSLLLPSLGLQVEGLDNEGNPEAVRLSGSVVGAIAAMGLSTALGYLRLLRVRLAWLFCMVLHVVKRVIVLHILLG